MKVLTDTRQAWAAAVALRRSCGSALGQRKTRDNTPGASPAAAGRAGAGKGEQLPRMQLQQGHREIWLQHRKGA